MSIHIGLRIWIYWLPWRFYICNTCRVSVGVALWKQKCLHVFHTFAYFTFRMYLFYFYRWWDVFNRNFQLRFSPDKNIHQFCISDINNEQSVSFLQKCFEHLGTSTLIGFGQKHGPSIKICCRIFNSAWIPLFALLSKKKKTFLVLHYSSWVL